MQQRDVIRYVCVKIYRRRRKGNRDVIGERLERTGRVNGVRTTGEKD
jgi:hypothetical protein